MVSERTVAVTLHQFIVAISYHRVTNYDYRTEITSDLNLNAHLSKSLALLSCNSRNNWYGCTITVTKFSYSYSLYSSRSLLYGGEDDSGVDSCASNLGAVVSGCPASATELVIVSVEDIDFFG